MPINGLSNRQMHEEAIVKIEARNARGLFDAERLQQAYEKLQVPDIPPAARHVWEWFIDLHAERQSSGFGPQPLNSTQLRDWCELTRRSLALWEVKAIKRLDVLWRSVWSEARAIEEQERDAKRQAAEPQRPASGLI